MAYDPKKLRLERVKLDVTYHATYTFYGLKGVIAERWAHGPIFGAVGEVGTGQLNLSPASGEGVDERIVAVAGIRTSGLVAEGRQWAPQAMDLGNRWFADIYKALNPKRTVSVTVEFFGLYPVRDEQRATQRLRERFYQDERLEDLAGKGPFHAAVEIMAHDEKTFRTIVLGVVGPPHAGMFFTFEDKQRDSQWAMGVRLHYAHRDPEGIEDPLATLAASMKSAEHDWERIGRRIFPAVVD
jgi:hypothetical protein